MRNRLLKALVVGCLLIIVFGMPLLLSPHRIRPSSARRIAIGMTIPEVVELLGAQPGCYDGYASFSGHYGPYPPPRGIAVWCSRHCWIAVRLDERGRVLSWMAGKSSPVTSLAKLWDRLAPPPMVWTETVSSE